MARGEGRAADDAVDVVRDQLLVADPVLDGADRAVDERVRGRRHRRVGVHALDRDDAEVAGRELVRVARRAQVPDQIADTREPEPMLVDRVDVVSSEVVCPDLDVVELRQMRREEASYRATTDYADAHASSFALTSA